MYLALTHFCLHRWSVWEPVWLKSPPSHKAYWVSSVSQPDQPQSYCEDKIDRVQHLEALGGIVAEKCNQINIISYEYILQQSVTPTTPNSSYTELICAYPFPSLSLFLLLMFIHVTFLFDFIFIFHMTKISLFPSYSISTLLLSLTCFPSLTHTHTNI